jgi:hypothetical protein
MKKPSSLFNLVAGVSYLVGASLYFTALAAPSYVAHEWGTFTSVQGADGVQMAWNPLSVTDLPSFVHDWPESGPADSRTASRQFVTKATSATRQRMETPVIYFYADADLTVNVGVTFPQGTMTEWYPQANLPAKPSEEDSFGPKSLRWDNVAVVPHDPRSLSPGSKRTTVQPPNTDEPSHYYAARETDADLIRVNGETEKFLFYRGVGDFQAPLTIAQSGADGQKLSLRNTGAHALRHLFVYQVEGGQARFLPVPILDPGVQTEVAIERAGMLQPMSDVRSRLGSAMTEALTEAGLYAAEARAMVKTWDDSWFGENGLRVLYLLPDAWTDRVLPLTLEPKPAQVTRVMVGRAELITPKMESEVRREIMRYGGGDESRKGQAVDAVRALGLGRFLAPAVQRVTASNPQDKALTSSSAGLLEAASKPTVKAGRLAAK